MNYLINCNIVFVPGAYNGAIYDFNRNKIFSINHDANTLLLRYVKGNFVMEKDEQEYINRLELDSLINHNFKPIEYHYRESCLHDLNFAWLEITQACNLRCVHCYEGQKHICSNDKLSLIEWKRIIKELHDCGCSNIQFIGGEPACYANVIDLIDFAGTLKFNSIGFFTNATLISDDLINCFVKNCVRVNVSIYGHNSEIHDKITTVNGSFDKMISSVHKMIEHGVNVYAAITIMKENEKHFEKIIKYVKSIGMIYSKFDLVRAVSGCRQNCHLTTRRDLIQKKYRTMPKFSITKARFDKAFYVNTCWHGKFAITENGDVLPCVFERDTSYGNLKNMSVDELLKSQQLNKYWYMDFSQIEECGDCEFRFACKDCRPLGKLNGGIDKKNIRCLYHPKTGVWTKIKENL